MNNDSTSAASYREAARDARYLCIVCFAWAAPGPGNCRDCGAPLHDIAQPEVLQTMHEEADRRLDRRQKREFSILTVVMIAIWLTLDGFTSMGLRSKSTLAIGATLILTVLYVVLRPGSAIATLIARSVRQKDNQKPEDKVPLLLKPGPLFPDLVAPQSDAPPDKGDRFLARFAGPDPDLLDAAGLVTWFGATLHG